MFKYLKKQQVMNEKLFVKIPLFGKIGEKGAKNGQIFNYNSRPQFFT